VLGDAGHEGFALVVAQHLSKTADAVKALLRRMCYRWI
jgi:hypothetical protein